MLQKSQEGVAGRESRDGNRRNHLGILPQAFVLQEKDETLEGVVGRVEYARPVEEFLSLLHLGQLTHAGKRAVNGLGRYRFRKS
jgi:CRISPR-associated endoribonuclease Cas6